MNTRFTRIQLALTIVLAAASSLPAAEPTPPAPRKDPAAGKRVWKSNPLPEKPNLIFILADDLGYGDLGCYGQKQILTPRIDAMAAQGMRWTQFYAGSTVCAPSRSVLMTGQHTGRTRIRGNGNHSLLAEDVTVATVLKEAGYINGCIGKWGLGDAQSPGAPWKHGFDFFYGFLDQVKAHFHYPEAMWRNDQLVAIPENSGGKRGAYAHDLMTREALEFIRQHREQPFFLYLPYTLPHAEILAPEDSVAPYQGKFEEKPYQGKHYASVPNPNATLAGMISRLDRDVGRILDLLDELGLDQRTLVCFTSDNGPARAGGRDAVYFDSNGPLRGIKRDLYEGGIRVPFISRWPGIIPDGTVTQDQAWFADWLPTAAELAGAKAPWQPEGHSLLPTLKGEFEAGPGYRTFYWEFYEQGSAQAVRLGNWKGVRQPMIHGPIELYHLGLDSAETNNLAENWPLIVQKIDTIMREEHIPSPWWTPPPAPAPQPTEPSPQADKKKNQRK